MNAAKIAAHASAGVKAAHGAAGLPGPPAWAGYWTFVSAAIIGMFILYTAKHGTLNTWVGFFSWSQPQPIGTTGASPGTGAAGQTGAAGAINSAVNGTGVGSAISNLTGVPPITLGTTGGGLLGLFGVGKSN